MSGTMRDGHTTDLSCLGSCTFRMLSLLELLQQFWTNLQQGQLPQLGSWNYVLLAFLILWQGPVATLLGGAAASAGLLKPELVFLAGMTGNLTADILWYSIGRSGNIDRLFKPGGRFGKYRARLNILQDAMRRHSTKILLMAKLSAGFALPTLVAAGFSRLRWRRWFPIVFIGESIWTGSLILIGYYATEAIKRIEHELQLAVAGFSFLFFVAAIWFIHRQLRNSEMFNVQSGNGNNGS